MRFYHLNKGIVQTNFIMDFIIIYSKSEFNQ